MLSVPSEYLPEIHEQHYYPQLKTKDNSAKTHSLEKSKYYSSALILMVTGYQYVNLNKNFLYRRSKFRTTIFMHSAKGK